MSQEVEKEHCGPLSHITDEIMFVCMNIYVCMGMSVIKSYAIYVSSKSNPRSTSLRLDLV
jgi:hypothetical protein